MVASLKKDEYMGPPSMRHLFSIVMKGLFAEEDEHPEEYGSPSTGISRSKFAVDGDTNYEELAANVDMLGTVLTDLDSYLRVEKAAERLQLFIQGLARLMSRIRELSSCESLLIGCELRRLFFVTEDSKGAELDRTRAKDELHRLRVRLSYQLAGQPGGENSLLRALGRRKASPVQKGLKDFFTKV